MAESTSNALESRATWLFYAVGVLLLLAFGADILQDDGVDWILLGAAAASFVAGFAYQRRRPRSD